MLGSSLGGGPGVARCVLAGFAVGLALPLGRLAARAALGFVRPSTEDAPRREDETMSTRMRDLLGEALGELRYEPTEKRVRALLGTETAVDSTRALLVWEPRRVVPAYAVPEADIRAPIAAAAPANDTAGGL